MIQWDGSHHDWLEGRGPWLTLVGAIDDATGEFLPALRRAGMHGSVHARAAQDAPRQGCPWSCYTATDTAAQTQRRPLDAGRRAARRSGSTQLGRVLDGLGIERIEALSPQAKGRVERMWHTHQDRLVSELRLAKASSCDEANVVLARYRRDRNRRFVVRTANAEPAWRKVASTLDLERVISFRYDATVRNDNTVRLDGIVIDIPPGPGGRSYARARVEVRQQLDGRWHVCTFGTSASLTPLRPPPATSGHAISANAQPPPGPFALPSLLCDHDS